MRTAPAQSAKHPECFPLDEALRREREAIWGPDRGDAPQHKASALCLSGGGIRSAAFCLGVLQTLGKNKLLVHFNYLSTVSGGGYIGSWLQAWLFQHARDAGRTHADAADILAVSEALGSGVAGPLARLRDFTSLLTPEAGLASRDSWAAIVLYVRNILINWAIFLPALFALALVPRLYRDMLLAMPHQASWPVLLIALLSDGFAVYFSSTRLPGHDGATATRYASGPTIISRGVVPAVLSAALLPVALAPFLIDRDPVPAIGGWGPAHTVPLVMFVVLLVAYGLAWLRIWLAGHRVWLFRASLFPWLIACALGTALLGAEIRLAESLPRGMLQTPELLAVLGPAAAMSAHLLLSAVFVALRVEVEQSDLDREWLARLSAVKVVPILLWAIFAAACLLIAAAILGLDLGKTWTTGAAVVSAVSGPAGAWLGKSEKTSLTPQGPVSFNALAGLLTFVFAIGLLSLLAHLGDRLLDPVAASGRHFLSAVLGLLVIALCGSASWALGRRINVNRFSLQGVYRNRLVRAFLGSVRVPAGPPRQRGRRLVDMPTTGRRTPDPFTDFDPEDNLPMAALMPKEGGRRNLFPVIGTTLNLVRGAARAGQERKGASFFITPAACGSPHLEPEGRAFAATSDYGGAEREGLVGTKVTGITLGTAMALSGAAVSPSMGYHSSAWTAFLMTLFNVRLGGWLSNPAVGSATDLQRGKPPNTLFALFREMLGLTDGTSPAIYLSDGGHFDNLGLYEMIRRRCILIVAIDAGEDGDYHFADLSGTVRKIRIDFDVEIAFTMPMPMDVEEKWSATNQPYALAEIHYPEYGLAPAVTGHLLYIKPCRVPDMPVDVRGYAFQDKAFPADSTIDQFFTESQFESYRRLGQFIGDRAMDDGKLADFLRSLRSLPI